MVTNLTKKQQQQVEKEVQKQLHEHLAEQVIQKTALFGSKFKEQTATALIAAFGLLIALAWKDVVTKFIETTFKTYLISQHPYIGLLLAAIIITAISIIGIALVSRWAKQPSQTLPTAA